ncbi:MAG: prepilin-type N-terminal cleavage/methylation domain-containing protein [Candidatus Aminicenantaceae bacterium]
MFHAEYVLAMSKMNLPGFTLIELLISFALITFLISETAQLTMHSLLAKRRADYNLRSAELAASKLEYFKSLAHESDELKEGIQTETIKEEGAQQIYFIEWRIQDTSSNMKRIELESYFKNCPQKKTRVILLLSKELGF